MEKRLVGTYRQLGFKKKKKTREVGSLNQHRVNVTIPTFSFLGKKIVYS